MDFEEDAKDVTFTNDDLKELAELAGRQVALEKAKADLEEQLKQVDQQLQKVSGVDIPTAMDAIGMSDFMLSTGERITVERKVKASIPKTKKPEAFAWLRANEFGSLIKNNVTASFGRGEDDKAKDLARKLNADGFTVDQQESVHAQTLSAFVREQLAKAKEDGRPVEIPFDLLGVYEYSETKVSKPK